MYSMFQKQLNNHSIMVKLKIMMMKLKEELKGKIV